MEMPERRYVTNEEFWELRNLPGRLDLIDGELIQMPGAGWTHGEVSVAFALHLRGFVQPRRLGRVAANDTGFRLVPGRDLTLCPDVAFLRTERLPPLEERDQFLDLAPDLAVEIVSPSDTPSLVARKVREYLAAGTEQVWVAYPPTRTIRVHHRDGRVVSYSPNDTLDGGDLLPGFAVRVAEFFPDG